ncbi:OsmC family protein [Jatrophihabitans sp. YIM 134969]
MPQTDLAPVVDALREAVTADASNAAVVFRAHATATDGPTSALRVNKHTFAQDEPGGFGGDDAAPGPVDYALAGLASCQIVVYKYWAAKQNVQVDSLKVDVEGDFDFRTMFGFEGGGRPGLSDVRVKVTITGPESEETYAKLQQQVDEHCPVFDLFSNATPVSSTLAVSSAV